MKIVALFLILMLVNITLQTKSKRVRINRYFENCNQIYHSGDRKSGFRNILVGGGSVDRVYCDHTRGGGWTKISHIKFQKDGKVDLVQINDKGLHYTEVLVRTGNDHYINYYRPNRDWYQEGYSLGSNCLRFGSNCYFLLHPEAHRGCGCNGNHPFEINHGIARLTTNYFDWDQIQVLSTGGVCRRAGQNLNARFCPREFIIKAFGRLSGIADLESWIPACEGDNGAKYDIEFFVR